MEINKFIQILKENYGEYNPKEKENYIINYLRKEYHEDDLDRFLPFVLKNFDDSYKNQPSIYALEKLKKEFNFIAEDELEKPILKENVYKIKQIQYKDEISEDEKKEVAIKLNMLIEKLKNKTLLIR